MKTIKIYWVNTSLVRDRSKKAILIEDVFGIIDEMLLEGKDGGFEYPHDENTLNSLKKRINGF